jgi:hypothetical protein
MNQGRPILTDPKKERMALSVLSETLESGQMITMGSLMLARNGDLPLSKAVDLPLLVGTHSITPPWKIIKKYSFVLPAPNRYKSAAAKGDLGF